MYDLSSYLAMMSSGLTTHQKLEEARFGKLKRKKKKKVSYRDYHVDWELTEDDLP